MNADGVELLSLIVIGVFLALLVSREVFRIFESAGGREWPVTLNITVWLLFAIVSLILLGRFALILTEA